MFFGIANSEKRSESLFFQELRFFFWIRRNRVLESFDRPMTAKPEMDLIPSEALPVGRKKSSATNRMENLDEKRQALFHHIGQKAKFLFY